MKKFIKRGFLAMLFPLLSCQNNDPVTQVLGVYRVYHLQVFDEEIDTSKGFVAVVTITNTDVSHVILNLDIRNQNDDAAPVETLCTLQVTGNKTQLIEAKTNRVLGYIEASEIHLSSSDSKGAKTEIVGRL